MAVRGLEDDRDTSTINKNVANLDAALAANLGHRGAFTLDLPRSWHTDIHAGCLHIPHPGYVGHFRGEPGLAHVDNFFGEGGKFRGAPAGEVLDRLAALESEVQSKIAVWDERIAVPEDATLSRLNPVVEGLAQSYATWLRIHPFADGNGRTGRVMANWVATRYWQPPVLPGRPVGDADGLRIATTPAIQESTADYRPLELHLRRRLKDARAAAVWRS